jgi:hypothetical protein
MFFGYYDDFLYIAFVLGQAEFSNASLEAQIKSSDQDMGLKFVIDIVCLIDIIFTFFTAYLKD